MNYRSSITAALVVVVGLVAFCGTASATNLNGGYTGTIHATAGTTELHGEAFSVSCKTSTVTGSVEQHGSGVTVKGAVSTLDFSECSFPVTVSAKGSLEVHTDSLSADGNGTLTSTGAKITIHGPFGINCLYETNATDIGTLTGSITTKATAKLDIDSSLIPRTGDSAFCGSAGEWTGSYTVTTPDSLSVDGGEGEGGQWGMTVSPKPSVKFLHVNERHIVTSKNTGFVTFNTLEVFVTSGFKLINGQPDTCTGTVMFPGESCLQMVECVTAGKTGSFLAVTTNTLATDSTKLEC